MESPPVDWVSPITVFAASLVAGALLVWRAYASARKRAPQPEAAPLALRDLLGKRDALVRQLREQEDTAAKRTPEQLARERYALELEAARVLLTLDTHGASTAPPRRRGAAGRESAAAVAPAAGNAALRGFLWGTASMAVVGLLLLLVLRSARPRVPGGSVTGETPMESSGSSTESANPSADTRQAELEAALARDPDDVGVRLDLARVYMVKGDMRAAWKETLEVLERSPGNGSALVYQGLMRFAAGQPEAAVDLLKQAITKEPDLLEAYLQLALVYLRLDRMRDAEATIAFASRRFPDKAAMMSRWLARTRQQAAQGQQAAGGSPRTGSEAETGRRVAGVIDLDAALRGTLVPGAVVWVIVRDAGAAKGPPIAVQRFPASAFPIAFSIGETDSMAGEPFPEKVRIEARIDSDGDPLTRNPSDPSARLDGVGAGAADLRLVMTR